MGDQNQRYDIFVSYARADRERVLPMIGALEAPDCRVFWDHDIPPGWTWDEYIGAQLEEATVVLVVWSKESISSEFVRTEASRARRRRALVPVRIDDIDPPVEFERVHAADLIDWTRAPQAVLPEALRLEVARRLAAAGRPAEPPAIVRDSSVVPPQKSAVGGEDAADLPAGYSLPQAVGRIGELVAARKVAMAELFAVQEALREASTARDSMAGELKEALASRAEIQRRLVALEAERAEERISTSKAAAAKATPVTLWRWRDLDSGGRSGVIFGGIVLLLLLILLATNSIRIR